MEESMVSIIVPVYNGENYIENCVSSIREQSCSDWELLLVDNGSVDKSLEICKRLAAQDKRIRIFHEGANIGVSAARNLAMDKARGEYLTFVDADDWLRADFLEVLLGLWEEKRADMVVCGYEKRFRQDGEEAETEKKGGIRAGSTAGSLKKQKVTKEAASVEYTREAYLENYLLEGNTHCWGALYSRKLVEDIRFPEGLSIGEDLIFLLDASLKAEKIVVTDYTGYRYFINAAGAMEKPFTPSYMDQILCWQQAGEKLLAVYPQFAGKLGSILLVSTLLVVGKLARLSKAERKKYRNRERYCHQLVKENSKKKEVYAYLPKGYPLKVRFYRYFPQLYLLAYGRWKA